jgi:hypothetical protein
MYMYTEAESKGKHGVRDPMPELTITSPYVHSRVDCNTFTIGNQPESTLSPSQRLWIWPLTVLYTGQYSSNISCACGSTGSSIWFGFRRLRYDGYLQRGDT